MENKKIDANIDIHGRIESFDQRLRSVDSRLRAVEKRLSIKTSEPESDDMIIIEDAGKDTTYESSKLQERLREIEQKLIHMEKINNEACTTGIDSLESQLSDAEHRITKLENLSKITIGKIKIPVELSGLVAAVVLLGTGYLISTGQWGVIRSSYYPITIGILFGAVVIAKFIMTNKK